MRRDALQLTELSLRAPDSSLTACSSRAMQTPLPPEKSLQANRRVAGCCDLLMWLNKQKEQSVRPDFY